MRVFYSHARKNDSGKKEGSKLLHRHTKGVAEKALRQIRRDTGFKVDLDQDLEALLGLICLYHDLGKYTSHFQNYLLGLPHDHSLKQHARFGAYAIWQRFSDHPAPAYILYFIIKNHHRSLHTPDAVDEDKLLSKAHEEEVKEVFEAQKHSVKDYIEQVEQEIGLSNLHKELCLPDRRTLYFFLKNWLHEQPNIQNYFLINYLFSLLIEADKLDASDTGLYSKVDIPNDSVDRFINSLSTEDNEQNRLRNQARREVLSYLEHSDIKDKRLFLLTAPTGIGKTLTALDFALRLRDQLPEQPQIIVGLPFINIIEQTLSVYQEVLAATNAKVLGHYQYADVFGPAKDNSQDEEPDYNRRRMELDTWQSDIVVTSFVQLLQTMISNRNKLLLKFNHLAGAIVVMDEVQSLRLEQVPVIGAVLFFMSRFLKTRFVLMTATKPLIFELADRVILTDQGISATNEVVHLLPDPERYFRKFHRTQVIPLLDPKLDDISAFIRMFKDRWSIDKSCLIVCNTVNRSIEVFKALQSALLDWGVNTLLYYLSTNVLPVSRLSVINQIKKDLKEGRKPILVATQVVEAGVDLDFDMGFRDLGPVDSIVQVAGRINRENSPDRRYAPLYVMDFGDCSRIYGFITETQARNAIGTQPVKEPDYFSLVEKYFWNLSDKRAYSYSKRLFRGMLYLQYSSADIEETEPIWKFRVIAESSHTASVFVEWDKKATAAREAYLWMLNAPNRQVGFERKEIFDKKHKKHFHQRIIAVPEYYTKHLPPIDSDRPDLPIKWVSKGNIQKWYVEPIGFNRERDKVEDEELDKARQL